MKQVVAVESLVCPCCEHPMILHECAEKFAFYRCKNCGFWTTRTVDGMDPTHFYHNEPGFEGETGGDWDAFIEEAAHIMQNAYRLNAASHNNLIMSILSDR